MASRRSGLVERRQPDQSASLLPEYHPIPALYHYEWHPRMPPQVAQPREGYLMSATGVALGFTLILAGVLNLLGTS